MTKKGKITVLLFYLSPIFCALARFLMKGTICTSQFFVSIWLILWCMSLNRRIIDKRQRRLLVSIAALLLFYCWLQIAKYSIFCDQPVLARYLWYCYYIPNIMVFNILFSLGFSIYLPEDQPLPKICKIEFLLGTVFLCLVLTNDLHYLFFKPHGGVWAASENYSHGPLYFVYYAMYFLIISWTFVIFLRKGRRISRGFQPFIPVIALFLLLVYTIVYFLGLNPRYQGTIIWNIGEMFCLLWIIFIESCIQVGLMPANTEYEKIAGIIPINAFIKDTAMETIITFQGKEQKEGEQGSVKHLSLPITGGSVHWEIDISELVRKENELADINEQLQTRMEFLQQENKMQEEKTRIATQNQLYDRILRIVKPQQEKIEILLDGKEQAPDYLAEVGVLLTYIKRCSNMVLTAERETLSSDELSMAILESMNNLKLCGVSTACNTIGSYVYSAGLIMGAYHCMEAVIEESLDSLESMLVTTICHPDKLTMRILLKSESISLNTVACSVNLAAYSPNFTVSKEQDELLLALELQEGGGL